MTTYAVRVTRMVHDIQSRTIEIEAPNKDAAEEMVLDGIREEVGVFNDFWTDAKTEVYDNDAPQVDTVEEVPGNNLREEKLRDQVADYRGVTNDYLEAKGRR